MYIDPETLNTSRNDSPLLIKHETSNTQLQNTQDILERVGKKEAMNYWRSTCFTPNNNKKHYTPEN